MKPPRSDKSFIDRLEVHIDTIVNCFISIISLFETTLNNQHLNIPSPEKISTPSPPPMSHLKNFSALILVNLYTPPPKILQPPPETFQTIEKKSQPLDTNSTTQRKCYPSVEYPPPQKKKNNLPTTRKKQN